MNPEISRMKQREDESRMQELGDLFALFEDDQEDNGQQESIPRVFGQIRVLPGLDTVIRLIRAVVNRTDYRALSQSIGQSLDSQKVDEAERTKLIINRLKREAIVFQLIKYSNHLISIYPKLQTMNYIEA